jgi:hypothetical protein
VKEESKGRKRREEVKEGWHQRKDVKEGRKDQERKQKKGRK